MKTYGFEQEFFVKKVGTDEFIVAPDSIPHDDCGYLVEARAEHHKNPFAARHMLTAAVDQIRPAVAKAGAELVLADTIDLPKEFLRTTLRRFGKNPAKAFFSHGGSYKASRPRAGLHIHFGTESRELYRRHIGDDDKPIYTRENVSAEQFNIPRIIWIMDQAFKEEIRAAKRVLGEYELKPWGFEYRSLPATINLDKVATVLNQIHTDPELA